MSVIRRRRFVPQALPPVRLSHAEEVGCCRCVQITESIQKYWGGRSARVPLPKLGPCLSGWSNHRR